VAHSRKKTRSRIALASTLALSGCGTLQRCPEPPPLPPPPAEAAKTCRTSGDVLPDDFSARPLSEQAGLLLEAWLASQEARRDCAERHESLIRYTKDLRK